MKRFVQIWAIIFFATSATWAQEAQVTVSINALGESNVLESANPGDSTEESLANLAYGMGAAHWYLDPVVMMIGSVFITNHNSHLNKEAFDQFLKLDLEKYRTVLSVFDNSMRAVDLDGTITRKIAGKPQLFEIQNFLKRVGVPEYAQDQKRLISPEILAIITNWLKGAQQMAASKEMEFYQAHPELVSTNIIKFFCHLTIQDVLEGYSYASLLYDINALDRVIEQLRGLGWLVDLSNLQEAKTNQPNTPGASQAIQKILDQKPKPLGASNAAAFMYRPDYDPSIKKCTVAGEPHQQSTYDQPGGPFNQIKLFKAAVTQSNGARSQVILAAYPHLPAFAGMHATAHSATAGTAAPTGSSLMFSTITDGSGYQIQGRDMPFAQRSLSLIRGTNIFEGKILGIAGFGDVFAWARDPETGALLALSMRPKAASSLVAGFWNRIISGLKNDSEGYKRALEEGLPLYGEAGCHPGTSPDSDRAYFALNQGKVDQVQDEKIATSLGFNFPRESLLKIGVQPQAVCLEQKWTTSDNGPLKSGCANPSHRLPQYIDPGSETFRQSDFKKDIQSIDKPLSVDDIFRISTSTYSSLVGRVLDLLIIAFDKFGAAQVQADLFVKHQMATQHFKKHDGFVQDDSNQILIFYLFQKIYSAIIKNEVAVSTQLVTYLTDPNSSRADVVASLSQADAQFLLGTLTQGIEFVETECQAFAVDTYSQSLVMRVSGQKIANSFAGPGYDSRSNGEFRFLERDGRDVCSIELVASSPNKFVYTGDTFYYLPFGPIVSAFAMEPKLYQGSNELWGVFWRNHNKVGEGFGGERSYRALSLGADSEPNPLVLPVVRQFVLGVPFVAATPTPTPTPTQVPTPSVSPSPNSTVVLKDFMLRLNVLQTLVQKLRAHPSTRMPNKKQMELRKNLLAEIEKSVPEADYILSSVLTGEAKQYFQDKFEGVKKRIKRLTKLENPKFRKVKRKGKRLLARLKAFCRDQYSYLRKGG